MGTPHANGRKTAADARLKLAEQALVPFETAHRDLSSLLTTLETKAQGTTAVAGVFLGATISILTRGAASFTPAQKNLIVVIAVSLAVAVLLALFALTPRAVALVLDPDARFRRVRHLLKLEDDEEFLALLADFYTEAEKAWGEALTSLRTATHKKATLVFFSHLATAVAIIAAIALIMLMLAP